MFRRVVALVALLIVPSVAHAQFPGGMGGMGGRSGMGGRRGGGMGRGGEQGARTQREPDLPGARDLERQDPVAFLIGRKKDLALADSQVAQLARMDAELMDRNRPLLARVDSTRDALLATLREGRERTTQPSDTSRRTMGEARADFMDLLQSIRANDDSATTRALALMTPAQRTTAQKLLDAKHEDEEKARRSRMSGDGEPGEGGQGGRGGRRP